MSPPLGAQHSSSPIKHGKTRSASLFAPKQCLSPVTGRTNKLLATVQHAQVVVLAPGSYNVSSMQQLFTVFNLALLKAYLEHSVSDKVQVMPALTGAAVQQYHCNESVHQQQSLQDAGHQ
jgi:hypothetical protein